MNYPTVLSESETIGAVIGGKSLARFGDGELKVVYGYGYARETPNKELTDEIREVLHDPHPNCMVAIPTMDEKGPKYQNWIRHKRRFSRVLDVDRVYGSAFVSRPDSSPWINNLEYALKAKLMWAHKRVVVVSEPKNSLLRLARLGAKKVTHVRCPRHGAYAEIGRLEQEALDTGCDIALLSVGVTATCLADRLCRKGMHAVDLGSAGGFLLKLLEPIEK